jgi:predicted DCC family thiol-disulfide oxidoreductase YuxK
MVILFDGVCNLCNGFVQFVLKRDKNKTFQFASLQSKYGTALSAHFHLPTANPDTIVLYDGGKIFTESDAVIKIISSLNGIWKITVVLKIISRFARNWAYRIVARNRYKFFGKKGQCMVPDWDVKDRFVDNETFVPNQD